LRKRFAGIIGRPSCQRRCPNSPPPRILAMTLVPPRFQATACQQRNCNTAAPTRQKGRPYALRYTGASPVLAAGRSPRREMRFARRVENRPRAGVTTRPSAGRNVFRRLGLQHCRALHVFRSASMRMNVKRILGMLGQAGRRLLFLFPPCRDGQTSTHEPISVHSRQ